MIILLKSEVITLFLIDTSSTCVLSCRVSRRYFVKFQVLTVASMNIRAVWDIALCSLVEVDRRFGGAYCLHHQGGESFIAQIGAVCTSETSVYSKETIWRYNPEGSNLPRYFVLL
jgi:hypothetical protein